MTKFFETLTLVLFIMGAVIVIGAALGIDVIHITRVWFETVAHQF